MFMIRPGGRRLAVTAAMTLSLLLAGVAFLAH